jgi:medium-chain acyl-[acyl-carrier-protein] hydrolase
MIGTSLTSVMETSWLVCPKPNPQARLRLFCFPYAGGNAMIYRQWQASLPPSVEVCAVQLPGRGKRIQERPFDRLQPLINAAARALLPFFDKPFAFLGHSMGGLISFELARQLRRDSNRMPAHLFVSGRRAPQLPSREAPTYDLPEAEFLDALRRLEGTPAGVLQQPELMQLMLPLLRADFAVCETYAYTDEPPLDCPISAFGGLQDSDVERGQLEAWTAQTTAATRVRMFPGDHFFINSQQPLLLRALTHDLHQLIAAL